MGDGGVRVVEFRPARNARVAGSVLHVPSAGRAGSRGFMDRSEQDPEVERICRAVLCGVCATYGVDGRRGYGMTNSADIARVVVRRTDNAGATWKKPTLVTDHGWGPSTSGRGTNVDVTWLWNGRVHYAHSTDTGATFGDYVALSPLNGHAFDPRVARGPGGVVAIAWNCRRRGSRPGQH